MGHGGARPIRDDLGNAGRGDAAGLPAQPTRRGDALQDLATAVHAYRRRADRHADGWALIGAFTAGRLLAPGPSG